MLNTTILKTHHYGIGEARKLLPYIQSSDVYSPENSSCTEIEASHLERVWETAISSGWTFAKFIKRNGLNFPSSLEPTKAYARLQFEYLFQSKSIIWFVERFSEKESKILNTLDGEGERMRTESCTHLTEGKVDQFLNSYSTIC